MPTSDKSEMGARAPQDEALGYRHGEEHLVVIPDARSLRAIRNPGAHKKTVGVGPTPHPEGITPSKAPGSSRFFGLYPKTGR